MTLYAVGTLAYWIGVGAALLFLWRLFEVLTNRALGGVAAISNRTSVLLWPATIAGFGLLTGTLLTGAQPAWQIPLVWVAMPLPAWIFAVCAGMAVWRLVQATTALSPEERIRRSRAAVAWGVAGAIGAVFQARSGESIDVLKGTLPAAPATIAALALLAAAAMLAMALAHRHASSRRRAYGFATHIALLAGSVLFGLPFAFLLVTSFKEDRDMVSEAGIIWVPKVQLEVPHFDEKNPLYETELEGITVQGEVIERFPDGQVKLDVIRPVAIRGRTFLTRPEGLKVVPEMAPLVRSTFEGQPVEGKVVENRTNGEQVVSILKPKRLQGRRFVAKPSEVEPIRKVGLKWSNYSESLEYLPPESQKGLVYLRNTLLLVVFNVVGTILSSSIVAYAFSRMRFPGKGVLFLLMLSTMMLPGAVTMLPQFLIFRNLGWVDTLYPLWIKALFANAFNVFLLRQFFMTIPMELEDAAKIDGSSYFGTFLRVMLPQIKPALAVIAVMTFVGAWNDFMGPLIYINSPENMPISYAVQLYAHDRLAEPGLVMAFVTMAMLPVLAVFFFAQRFFIEGVTLSGLGGR